MEKTALKYGSAPLAAASYSLVFQKSAMVDLDNPHLRWLNSLDKLAADEIAKKYEQHKDVLGKPYDDITPLGDGWYKQTYTKTRKLSLETRMANRLKSKAVSAGDNTLGIPASDFSTLVLKVSKASEAGVEMPVTITPTALHGIWSDTTVSFGAKDAEPIDASDLYQACLPHEFALQKIDSAALAVVDSLQGAIYFNANFPIMSGGPFVIHSAAYTAYKKMDEELGPLGFPQADEIKLDNGGTIQYFQNGCIYCPQSGQAIVIHGDIYKKWVALDKENGYLGYPKTSIIVQSLPLKSEPEIEERHADFDGGGIYSYPYYGTYVIHGKIYSEWERLGKDLDRLRILISDTSIANAAYKNYFSGALGIYTISWSQAAGYIVESLVDDILRNVHKQNAGVLGARSVNTTVCSNGWTKLVCENGAVYYRLPGDDKSGKGPFIVYGEIYTKYVNIGAEEGMLSFPKMSVNKTPDGLGKYVYFEGGSIYWSPQSGAHEIHGNILSKYGQLGWETGYLRYPLTDEQIAPDGVGRFNHFQGGAIYWRPGYGAKAVHVSVLEGWKRKGYEKGCFGYPLEDSFGGSVSAWQQFQGGYINYDRYDDGYRYDERKTRLRVKLTGLWCDETYYKPTYTGAGGHYQGTGFEKMALFATAVDNNFAEYRTHADLGYMVKKENYFVPGEGTTLYSKRPPIVLFDFPIEGAGWPKEYVVTIALVNQGYNSSRQIMGNPDGFQQKILSFTENEVRKFGTELGSSVGAIAGTFLGGGPWGMIIGGAAGAFIGKLVDGIKSLFGGDDEPETEEVYREPEIVYTPYVFKIRIDDAYGNGSVQSYAGYKNAFIRFVINHNKASYHGWLEFEHIT